MLESLAEESTTVGQPLTAAEWACSLAANMASVATMVLLVAVARELLVEQLRLSAGTIAVGGLLLVVAITAALYIYFVYVVSFFAGQATTSATPVPRSGKDIGGSSEKPKTQ